MIRAVLDADVLYPLPLRDTLLSAAAEGCFQPVWSAEILDEAIRNLVADDRTDAAGAASLCQALDDNFEDALVEGYESLIPKMPNHPKDRHVTACAMHARANLIVTSNGKDFVPLPDGVVAISPDDFLRLLMTEAPSQLEAALAAQAARLKKPPMAVADILELLRIVAPRFVESWLGET